MLRYILGINTQEMGCGGSTSGSEPSAVIGGGAPNLTMGLGTASGKIVVEQPGENEISMGVETEFEPELLAE